MVSDRGRGRDAGISNLQSNPLRDASRGLPSFSSSAPLEQRMDPLVPYGYRRAQERLDLGGPYSGVRSLAALGLRVAEDVSELRDYLSLCVEVQRRKPKVAPSLVMREDAID